jgi:hypothetical protein
MGTTMSGVRAPVNSALATVVLVTPVKKNVMFNPNARPGSSAALMSSQRNQRCSVARRMPLQMTVHRSMRQKAMVTPGVWASFTSVLPALNDSTATPSAMKPRVRPCALRSRAGAAAATRFTR